MGASFYVETHSHDEFDALQSEGVPQAHMTYSSTMRVMEAAGHPHQVDDYVFVIDAADIPPALEALRDAVFVDPDFWQASAAADVLEAAMRLGRGVYAA